MLVVLRDPGTQERTLKKAQDNSEKKLNTHKSSEG